MSASDKIKALKEKQAKEAAAKTSGQTVAAVPVTPTQAPTTMKEEKAKEPCEFCGNEFSNLASHTKKCKDNPVNVVKIAPAAPAAPAFDVKSFFDEFKKYVVTPDQLMVTLKVEAEQAKADRDRLDAFMREHQTPTPTMVGMDGVPEAIKDLVTIIKDQSTKPVETKPNDEILMALKSLNTELQRKADAINVKEREMQLLRDTVETLKRGVTREMPPELTMLITSVSKSWMDLLEPIEKRWKDSTGYMKIIDRLKQDIGTLMSFAGIVPVDKGSSRDVKNVHVTE